MSKTPRLVLHIGTEKTGTTSIQEFLRVNKDQFLRRGVFIPSFLGHSNHSLLPAIAYRDERNDDLSLAYALHDSQSRASRRRDTIALLQQSAQTYPQHTVVISSEHLQSRLTDPEELQRLHNLLAPIYSSIQILLYIRKPIDTAISSLSTGIKCGKTATRIPPPSAPYIQNLCMHRQTVERWATTFGLSNITVRLFSRQHFKDGDLLRDFAAASAIPFDDDLAIPTRTNEKLGFDGLRFLGLINEQVPYIAEGRFNPLRANLVSLFESHFCESPEYAPSQQEIDSYADFYRKSDEWIRQRFFAHLPALWPDTAAVQRALNHPAQQPLPGLADNPEAYNPAEVRKLLRLFAEAWNEKQSQISQLRDQLAAAEAKRTTAGPTTTTPGTTSPTSPQPN